MILNFTFVKSKSSKNKLILNQNRSNQNDFFKIKIKNRVFIFQNLDLDFQNHAISGPTLVNDTSMEMSSSTTAWKPKNLIFFSKKVEIEF